MGIKGLSTCLNQPLFKKSWKPVNLFEKKVIIDGYNISYALHQYNRQYNREEFQKTVEDFLCKFKEPPIVVFDGVKRCMRPRAPLAILVFIKVLKSLKFEYYMADGEADRDIAVLANHHNCPVLSSDSDFFIFNLKAGLICFDRYYRSKEPGGLPSLYKVEEFWKQSSFKLKDPKLCLLLPAIFGTNRRGGKRTTTPAAYEKALGVISKHDSIDNYLSFEKPIADVRHKLETHTEYYWDLPPPTSDLVRGKQPAS